MKEVLKDKNQIFMSKKKEGGKESKTEEKDYFIVIKDKKS